MENFFEMNLPKKDIDAISNLGLAHIGDGVFELLCRSYLCAGGGKKVGDLHKATIAMVKAPAQAKLTEKLLPLLTEEELAFYRRGKNPSPPPGRNTPRPRAWKPSSAHCI